MHTLLHGMQGRNLFSKMDLHLAFTGVPVDIDSIPLMTIMTHRGPYHILRCTFGASDVPAAFQHEYRRVFDEADADNLNQSTSLFVDDSLTGATIGGPSRDIIDAGLDNHLQFHEKVFTALIARGWRISIAKCLFLSPTGEFCGVVTDGQTVRADPARTESLLKMPPPRTYEDLRRLVGVVNWWQPNVPNSDYLRLRARLEHLLRQNGVTPSGRISTSPIGNLWDDNLQAEFDKFKTLVSSSVQLLPDPSLPTYYRTDASDKHGCSVTILQFDRQSGKPRILASYALLWRTQQLAWPPGRKEAYAQFMAVTRWAERYSKGLPIVLLESDAANLTSTVDPAGNVASKDRQIAQWYSTMLAYPFVSLRALRQPGPVNDLADLLSRPAQTRRTTVQPDTPVSGHRFLTPTLERILEAQRRAPPEETASAVKQTFHDIGDVLFVHGSILVPASATGERSELLKLAHDSAGHTGIQRTSTALKASRYFWPSMTRDIIDYVTSCVECQFWKTPKNLPLLGDTTPTQAPWPFHTLYIDVFGAIRPSMASVLLITCAFTRFVWLILINNPSGGVTAADAVKAITQVTSARGQLPRTIRVDAARALTGRGLTKFCTDNGINLDPSPPHAHHTLGAAESKNHVLASMAKCLWRDAAAERLSSQDGLDVIAALMRAAHCREIGTTPYHAMYGRHPDTPLSRTTGILGDSFDSSFSNVHDYLNRLSIVHEYVSNTSNASTLADAAARNRSRPDPPSYAPRDLVLLWFPAGTKWEQFYRGPYVVSQRINDNWYRVVKLEHADDLSGAPSTEISVARMRRFDAGRTTIAKLLARDLDGGYAIISSVLAHRTRPSGELEFEILWHNDIKTWSTVSESSLQRNTILISYFEKHGIDKKLLATATTPSTTATTPGAGPVKRGRPRKHPLPPGGTGTLDSLDMQVPTSALHSVNFAATTKALSEHHLARPTDPARYARANAEYSATKKALRDELRALRAETAADCAQQRLVSGPTSTTTSTSAFPTSSPTPREADEKRETRGVNSSTQHLATSDPGRPRRQGKRVGS